MRTSFVDTKEFDDSSQLTKVGNDVWIGANAFILGGISIGNGAVIGTGAVVTKDVVPYTIVGGVPARVIGRRYNSEVANTIESIRWWDWDDRLLKKSVKDFKNIEVFLSKYS